MIDMGTGAYPVFTDVDGDGLTDLVIGSIGDMDSTYYNNGVLQTHRSAQLAWYKNVGTRQKPVFQLYDTDFGGLSTLKAMGLVPTLGDLNGDGRLEMLVGTEEGRLLRFDADFNLVDDDFLHFEKAWSAPCLFDVDSDGVLDLVVGDESGKLAFYQGIRQGNETQFSFVTDNWGGVDVCDHTASYFGYSVPTLFRKGGETLLAVGSEQGKVFLFKDLGGSFSDISNHWSDYVCEFENCFGLRSAAALADLDADGTLEMAVGNFSGGLELLNGDISVNQGVEEDGSSADSGTFVLYPNPARGHVTIEGTGLLKVLNLLGQTILEKEINGRTTIALPQGFWMVRLNGCPKKVIVE